MTDFGLRVLPGVGPVRERHLKARGIYDLRALLEHVPRAYRCYAQATGVEGLRAHQPAAVVGTVEQPRLRALPGGLWIVSATLRDAADRVVTLLWFYRGPRGMQVARRQVVQLQQLGRVIAYGTPLQDERGWTMRSPHVADASDSSARRATEIVPVYPLINGVSAVQWQRWTDHALRALPRLFPEFLTPVARERWHLPDRVWAWREVHRPSSAEALQSARRRLAFDEALLFFLRLLGGDETAERKGVPLPPPGELTRRWLATLPFELTADQRRAMADIDRDLQSPRPMRRLLQGDVGSGKTVVAAYALVRVAEAGWQGAIMAPTELLAEQLADVLHGLLNPVGVRVGLLSGRLPAARRRILLQRLRSGEVGVIVGTHALLSEDVVIPRLALAIVDEEHRFGVAQRERFGSPRAESGRTGVLAQWPHRLSMTATPIPRTLSLILYGETAVSSLHARPSSRGPVDTRWLPEFRRDRAYQFIRRLVEQGRQAYVVYPRLEKSEPWEEDSGAPALAAVARSARAGVAQLKKGPLRGLRVELLHSRLPLDEKRRIMRAFRDGTIDVLVATTVVEVGLDVPNASVIAIEDPDYFGLAQLHQLRGRVGRGHHPGYCLLIGGGRSAAARERLRLFRNCHDGFVLAEQDLLQRGPGEALGWRQSGASTFRFLDPTQQLELLRAARSAASVLLECRLGEPWAYRERLEEELRRSEAKSCRDADGDEGCVESGAEG